MSVLMSAMRRADQKKSAAAAAAKKKKKRALSLAAAVNGRSSGTLPPMSNETTTVWYWHQDGIPTTIMFNKETCEVWCNGYMLDTVEGTFIGGALTFGIYIQETDTIHQGRIIRFSDGIDFRHQLYVNDVMISEHTNRAQVAPSYAPRPLSLEEEYPYDDNELLNYYEQFDDLPPSYEDALLHPLADCSIDESKKSK